MRILTLVFCLLASKLSFTQTINDPSVEQDNGKVFLLRSTGFGGGAVAYNFFVDDVLACRLMNNCYSVHLIAPGTHKFFVQFSGKKPKENAEKMEINIEAGKEYFLQITVETGAFRSKVYCQELTENSAKQSLKRLKPAGSCN